MNKVILIGRLGKDPEIHYTADGSPIANLRIATTESYTDRGGNKIERTEWHTVVVFQRQAENCKTYLSKGSLVLVEGSVQTRKWKDQQGQNRYTTEVRANYVQFLESKNQQDAQPHYEQHVTSEPAYESNTFKKQDYGTFPSEGSDLDDPPF